MKFLLALLLFTNVQAAEYTPVFRALVDGQYEKFRELAYHDLQKEQLVLNRRELLKIVMLNKKKFYNADNFRGVVLPYNNGKCENAAEKEKVCSSYQDYDFLLEVNDKPEQEPPREQTFAVRYGKKNILKFPARIRSKLGAANVSFGRALHLIYNKASDKKFFLLIRETETLFSSSQAIFQTINVFRVEDGRICRIAEANITDDDTVYELIAEYIRTFGGKTDCSQPVISL